MPSMGVFTDAVIFSAGYVSKLLVTAILMELTIRPIAKHLARKIRNNESSILLHYLADHGGKSYQCQRCQIR